MKIEIKKLDSEAVLPTYSNEGDAGMDFYSSANSVVCAGEYGAISTGISMAIPEGYVGLIWPRSGLAAKKGIDVYGGVIDSGYRGEIKVILYNSGNQMFEIKKGDKIAQMLIQRVERADLIEVGELETSLRGEKGFGSSGGHSSLG